MRIHATAVNYNDRGVLIRGKSGSGKSTLAHLLLNNANALGLNAALISDDIVSIKKDKGHIIASAPKSIFGLMEVRGYGLINVKAISSATIHCIIDIEDAMKLEQMPDESELTGNILDVIVRRQPVPNNSFHRMLLLSLVAIDNIPRI